MGVRPPGYNPVSTSDLLCHLYQGTLGQIFKDSLSLRMPPFLGSLSSVTWGELLASLKLMKLLPWLGPDSEMRHQVDC